MFLLTSHTRSLALASAIAIMLAASVIGATLGGNAADVPAPTLTADDASLVGVTLTDIAPVVDASGVNEAAAIAVAATVAPGVADGPQTVLAGLAAPSPGATERPVWVVVVNGGRAPSWGPARLDGIPAKPLVVRLTGVIVDRDTGEVIRWFTLADLPADS